MDEFDSLLDFSDVPLHERVNKKRGNKNSPESSSPVRAAVSPSVSLTPPPPFYSPTLTTSPAATTRGHTSRPYSPEQQTLQEAIQKSLLPKKKVTNNTKRKAKINDIQEKPAKKKVNAGKEYKDAEKIFNKQTDKGEVNKYMLVCIDPEVVSSPPGTDILNTLSNPPSGKPEEIFQFCTEKQTIPSTIAWKRKILYLNTVDGQPVFHEEWIDEQRVLLFATAEQLAVKINDDSFETWAQSIKCELGERCHITLIVLGYNKYVNEDKNAQERAKKAAIRGEAFNERARTNRVSQYDFEMALLSLSMDDVMDYLTFDKSNDKTKGWKECAGLVFHHTRAIAEAPEKLKKNISNSAGFDFYAADIKDSISAKNLYEYWKQMLMQVTSMSLEKAASIAQKYPSPSSLIQAYRSCSSEREAAQLLANIEIRRVDTIVGGTRRLGDEISRKIYCALTSEDPLSFLAKQ